MSRTVVVVVVVVAVPADFHASRQKSSKPGGKDEAVRGRGGPWMPTCRGRRLVGPRIFGDLPIFRWIVVVVGRRAGGILRF